MVNAEFRGDRGGLGGATSSSRRWRRPTSVSIRAPMRGGDRRCLATLPRGIRFNADAPEIHHPFPHNQDPKLTQLDRVLKRIPDQR